MGNAEKKVELPLQQIYDEASEHLLKIKNLFPDSYKLTLVARNTAAINTDIVLSEDPDHEAVHGAIDTSKVEYEEVV
jgi:hypothetical protein